MIALRFMAVLILITGVLYPLAVTAVSEIFFSEKARGSLIYQDQKVLGSRLIAQSFESPKYFWPRPSANGHQHPSGGSNLSPATAAFWKDQRIMASASGLDPHILPEQALAQVARIAYSRGISPEIIKTLVISQMESPDLGLFGEARVNVLTLNMALDTL